MRARVTRIMRAYSLTSIGRDLRATTDLSKFNRLAFRGTTKKQLDCVPNLKQRKKQRPVWYFLLCYIAHMPARRARDCTQKTAENKSQLPFSQ